MTWYLTVLSKYAVFSGRARRKEYWFFALIHIAIVCVLFALDLALGTGSIDLGAGLLSGLYGLALLVPSIAVGVRRLHDSGKSGWFLLISIIPLIGGLVVLVLMLLPGTPGANSYGPDPRESFG